MNFNLKKLSNRLNSIKKEYDIIIIGGGIYGATLFWEATARGLQAILLEKNDFCNATSANSLKIIHGGLRYLQNFDFKRVRDSSKELKLLLNLAPHLIHPLPCIVPTNLKLKKSKLSFRIAHKAYKFLSYDRNRFGEFENKLPEGKIFSIAEFRRSLSDLSFTDITGGAVWYDALNYNSERLVVEFITSAARRGGDPFNYIEAQELIIRNGRAIGVSAYDYLSEQDLEIRGKIIANATGPWINKLANSNASSKNQRIHFAKAVNLIVPKSFSDFAFGLESKLSTDDLHPAKRYLFFVPWRSATMIGTWYFTTEKSPDNLTLNESELDKCIAQINDVFPAAKISKDDVSYVHLGQVPVKPMSNPKKVKLLEHHSSIPNRSRNTPDNFISVLGLKYTTARKVAEETVKHLFGKLGKDIELPRSKALLDGGDLENLQQFMLTQLTNNTLQLGEKTIQHLIFNYGANYEKIVDLIALDESLGNKIPGCDNAIVAELLYCIKNEYTVYLADLLLRRMDLGSLKKPSGTAIEFCATFMAELMGWTLKEKQEQINSFLKNYNRVCPG